VPEQGMSRPIQAFPQGRPHRSGQSETPFYSGVPGLHSAANSQPGGEALTAPSGCSDVVTDPAIGPGKAIAAHGPSPIARYRRPGPAASRARPGQADQDRREDGQSWLEQTLWRMTDGLRGEAIGNAHPRHRRVPRPHAARSPIRCLLARMGWYCQPSHCPPLELPLLTLLMTVRCSSCGPQQTAPLVVDVHSPMAGAGGADGSHLGAQTRGWQAEDRRSLNCGLLRLLGPGRRPACP